MVEPFEFALRAQFSAAMVRWTHFVAMGTVLGGAVVVAVSDRPPATLVRRYEYLFWVAIGLVVVTGIGNIGQFTPRVPEFGSRWSQLFTLKLFGILGLLVISIIRTGLVVRIPKGGVPDRRWYLLTTIWVAAIVAVAVVMARG